MSVGSEMAEGFAAQLGEHFDSVIILCTVHEEGGTRVCVKRRGNYYAIKGVLVEWLEDEANQDLAEKLKPEDSGE